MQQYSTRVQGSVLNIDSSDNAYLSHDMSCTHALMTLEELNLLVEQELTTDKHGTYPRT